MRLHLPCSGLLQGHCSHRMSARFHGFLTHYFYFDSVITSISTDLPPSEGCRFRWFELMANVEPRVASRQFVASKIAFQRHMKCCYSIGFTHILLVGDTSAHSSAHTSATTSAQGPALLL